MPLLYQDRSVAPEPRTERAYGRIPRATVARRSSNPIAPDRIAVHEGISGTVRLQIQAWAPVSRRRSEMGAGLKETFEALRDKWVADTEFMSNVSQMIQHPAHLAIIGLGPDALPLLLEDLRDNGNEWFWALRAVVRSDAADGLESFEDARQAWIEWGRQRHLI